MYILIILGVSRFVSRRGVNDATSSVPLRGVYRIKFYVTKLVGRGCGGSLRISSRHRIVAAIRLARGRIAGAGWRILPYTRATRPTATVVKHTGEPKQWDIFR